VKRLVFRIVGLAATALAVAGLFVPLLPTTVFLIVAAWAFGRSSPTLEAWLRNHPRLGPLIADWEERGAVPRPAKAAAVAGMGASLLAMWLLGVQPWAMGAAAAVLAVVAAWLISRPV